MSINYIGKGANDLPDYLVLVVVALHLCDHLHHVILTVKWSHYRYVPNDQIGRTKGQAFEHKRANLRTVEERQISSRRFG